MKIVFILIGFLIGGVTGIFIHAHITNTLWTKSDKVKIAPQEYRLSSCDTSIVIRNSKTTMMITQYFDKK